MAGPCDPQLPLQDVTRNIRSAFRKKEKLAEPGKAKVAMSQKQRQKLAKEIEQVTQEYGHRHSHILTGKNITESSDATLIPSFIPYTIYTATDADNDLDNFSSLPPSSDPPDLPRLQEELQNPRPTKRPRLSTDKQLALSAVS